MIARVGAGCCQGGYQKDAMSCRAVFEKAQPSRLLPILEGVRRLVGRGGVVMRPGVGYAFGAHLNQNGPQVVTVGSDGRRPLCRCTIAVNRHSDMAVATERNRLVYVGHASACRGLCQPPRIAPRDLIDVGLGQRLSLPSRLGPSPRLSSIPLSFTSGHLRKNA